MEKEKEKEKEISQRYFLSLSISFIKKAQAPFFSLTETP